MMIVLVLLADGSSTSGDEEDEDNKGYGNIIPGSWPEYGDEDKGGSGAVKLAAKAKAAVKAAADGDKKARPAVFTKEGRLFEDFFENQTKMERLESIRALKEKNRHDQKRRRAERQRRKTKPHHQGKKNRVNRNTKR